MFLYITTCLGHKHMYTKTTTTIKISKVQKKKLAKFNPNEFQVAFEH